MSARNETLSDAIREAREACDGLPVEDAKHQLEMWEMDREVNGSTPQNKAYCEILRNIVRKK